MHKLDNTYDIKVWARNNKEIATELGVAIYKSQKAKTIGEVLAKTSFNDAHKEIDNIKEIITFALEKKDLAKAIFLDLYKEFK